MFKLLELVRITAKLIWNDMHTLLPPFFKALHNYKAYYEYKQIVFYNILHPRAPFPPEVKAACRELVQFLVHWWQ